MNVTSAIGPTNDLHPWVAQTKAYLDKAQPGNDGLIRASHSNRLNLCVGKGSVQRATQIWNRILKSAEVSDFKIRMGKEYPWRTVFIVDGENFSLTLKEKTTRVAHVPSSAEQMAMKRLTHLHGVPSWDYRPSGTLALAIDYLNCHNQTVNQVTWTDGKKKSIEDRLDTFGDVLLRLAKDIKLKRAWAEEQYRGREEEERQRKEAERLQAEEKQRADQLEHQAAKWMLSCSIRQFIDAVRHEATRLRGTAPEPGSPLALWIQGAERLARGVDPVGSIISGFASEASVPK